MRLPAMMLPMTTGRGVCAWVAGVLGAAIALGSVAYPGGGEIRFTIREGHVTLIASDALRGDVLAEWGRAGDTRFVDAGELDQVPVSLHLVDVPEAGALRLLLRPAPAGRIRHQRSGIGRPIPWLVRSRQRPSRGICRLGNSFGTRSELGLTES